MWKSEGCFLAGVDPWRRAEEVSDAEVLEVVRGIRPLMRMSVERGGRIVTYEPSRPAARLAATHACGSSSARASPAGAAAR